MKLNIDWGYMRKFILIFTVSLVVSVITAVFNHVIYKNHINTHQGVENQIQQLNEKLAHINLDNNIITSNIENFKQLLHKGIIENEHRLKWVNTFRTQTRLLNIQVAKYQILPQNELKVAALTNNHVQIFVSKMKIDVHVLHEFDLVRLIQSLKTSSGYFHLNRCQINRSGEKITFKRSAVNFIAECEIDWFTLKPTKNTDKEAG